MALVPDLQSAIVDVLRASPLLTVSDIIDELEVSGLSHLLPSGERAHQYKAVWQAVERLPNRLSVEQVEIIPHARRVRRYTLVEVE